MTEGGAAQRLADELQALRAASGLSFTKIVAMGGKLRPPVTFSKGSLSDWFSGKLVPSEPKKFEALIGLLEQLAMQKQPDHQRRDFRAWESLRREAADERRCQAATPSPPAVEENATRERLPVVRGDAAKAARVLTVLPHRAPWLHALRTNEPNFVHYETQQKPFDEACESLRREVVDFVDPELHEAYGALFTATEAFEYQLDGMYGPDSPSPWRVLTNHQPQRLEQLDKLIVARDEFDAKYRALIKLFSIRGLLPTDRETEVERAARADAETAGTLQALIRLGALRNRPNEHYDIRLAAETPQSVERDLGPRGDHTTAIAAWDQERQDLISGLHSASIDLHDSGLLELIDEVRLILINYQTSWNRLQRESYTRRIAIEHAVASIRMYRQGRPRPPAPADYRQTLDYIHEPS
ncbi:hypothetical protein [Kitasatospora griseola]|uniref:hypothetical protein n=1 Tax=Kitasatospora griseola TaxID=2064 RepID=UPI003820BF76